MAKEIKEKSTQSIEDRKLIAVLKNNKSTSRQKEKAFNDLYSKHQRNVSGFFLKRLNFDEDLSEDLKMVTFEKVHKNIKKYDETFAFSTWLYKIARNTLIDNSRKAKFEILSIERLSGKTSGDGDIMVFQINSDCLTPEEELVRSEETIMVQDAIESIDNELIKELMKLRFIKELSFDEIAKEMRIPNNSTLRVSISRGKEILKNAIENPFA